MAQTRRKRRSKHRGNAAGTIETRGRTGRRVESDGDPKKGGSRAAGGARPNRFDRPPTWRSAGLRALLAAALLFVLFQIGIGPQLPPLQALALCLLAVGIYAPLGYMTDRFLYNRRRRKVSQR